MGEGKGDELLSFVIDVILGIGHWIKCGKGPTAILIPGWAVSRMVGSSGLY